MSPKCKVSFFFLFKLFTKSSWKSERQLPLQGLRSTKTTTEQNTQRGRTGSKLAFGFIHRFPQAGVLANRVLDTRGGVPSADRRLCAVRLWGAAGSLGLSPGPFLYPPTPAQAAHSGRFLLPRCPLPSAPPLEQRPVHSPPRLRSASPSATHFLTSVPKALRQDGAKREGKFPAGTKGLAGLAPRDSSYWVPALSQPTRLAGAELCTPGGCKQCEDQSIYCACHRASAGGRGQPPFPAAGTPSGPYLCTSRPLPAGVTV